MTNQEEQINKVMGQLLAQAHLQFGDAVKGAWLHDQARCPGCARKAGRVSHKGKTAVSLNAYIYRRRGILIGYRLCNRCANMIHRANKRNPGVQIGLHYEIEENLGQAYENHLNSLDG